MVFLRLYVSDSPRASRVGFAVSWMKTPTIDGSRMDAGSQAMHCQEISRGRLVADLGFDEYERARCRSRLVEKYKRQTVLHHKDVAERI